MKVLRLKFGMSGEIIEICKDIMSQVVKTVGHGTLKSGPNILQIETHDVVNECSPWTSKSSFQLIGITDTYLVIYREVVHKG